MLVLIMVGCTPALFAQGPLSFGELKSAYEAGVKSGASDYEAALRSAAEKYTAEMSDLADELQKLGDLGSVIWIKEELDRFGAMGVIAEKSLAPKPAPMRTMQLRYIEQRREADALKSKKIAALSYVYLGKLDKLVQKYTNLGQKDWASKINVEIERVKSSTAFMSAISAINRVGGESTLPVNVKAKVVQGNVALAEKGAFVIAENNGFSMIDGDRENYTARSGYAWARAPAKFMISLPEAHMLSRLRIQFMDSDGSAYQYKVSTSLDAESWQPLVDRSSGVWTGLQEHKFQARAVQDIQIEGLFNSRGPHFCIVEVEAYCE